MRPGQGAAVAAVMLGLAAGAAAEGWDCSSGDLPLVSCDAQDCTVEPATTPVSVTLEAGGAIAPCLFTGCYEGPVTAMLRDGGLAIHVAREAGWLHDAGLTETVALVVNEADGVGILSVAGYRTPVLCVPGEAGGRTP
jgi:hypothetical protein